MSTASQVVEITSCASKESCWSISFNFIGADGQKHGSQLMAGYDYPIPAEWRDAIRGGSMFVTDQTWKSPKGHIDLTVRDSNGSPIKVLVPCPVQVQLSMFGVGVRPRTSGHVAA